jgi:hypothetical protein
MSNDHIYPHNLQQEPSNDPAIIEEQVEYGDDSPSHQETPSTRSSSRRFHTKFIVCQWKPVTRMPSQNADSSHSKHLDSGQSWGLQVL